MFAYSTPETGATRPRLSNMKSAIFQDVGSSNKTRQPRKQTQKKWPRTSSPFVVPNSAASSPKWNLDDMLSNYTASGILPPPLSPTLPPRFASKETPELNANKHTISDDDVDTDSLPLSLLSPTLPSMFQDTKVTLAHPLPEKPSTVHSVLHGDTKPSKNNRVRWVDKLDDPNKPRFLLRICFSSSVDAYRKINHSKPQQSIHKAPQHGVQGLAITGLKPDNGPSIKSLWPKGYKEFSIRYTKSSKEDTLLSITAQFDWILCSSIACDHATANKSKVVPSSAESWGSLLTDIPSFVHRIERFIKGNKVSDKKKSYLSFFVGVLAVCKALILKRANSVLLSSIETASQRDSSTAHKEKVIAIQEQVIQNYRKIEGHFAESQSFFKNSPSPSTVCPKTWSLRSPAIPKPVESLIAPSSDAFFLPLGPYSDLAEACAFLYGCLREFIDIFEIELIGGGRYHLQSGQRAKL
ncbi:hypothetical protein JCM33374_g1378 [Metschnikowia sp. JCM 33374]|nr:hypothetical protein JCM33374_g1378 [Metschnikowia sp. JCM 33374]